MKYKFKYNMLLQNDITSKNYFWLSNTRDDKQAIEYFIKCSKNNTFNCYGALITCNEEKLWYVGTTELVREPLKGNFNLYN